MNLIANMHYLIPLPTPPGKTSSLEAPHANAQILCARLSETVEKWKLRQQVKQVQRASQRLLFGFTPGAGKIQLCWSELARGLQHALKLCCPLPKYLRSACHASNTSPTNHLADAST
eukprot:TRINITY_DN43409_c0_g1_i1.p1 TRINITY_DN43409_c0_g1~~TRINITY_DN43409_c0_g1_i1.p1  ORF type:complete len:117 (-),score=14.29 TRINITY_DN43409_c0_g1_i1:95-445(-)